MKVTVCIGSSCHIKGSRQVVEQLQYLISENNLGDKVELGGTFCMGKCQQGVCVTVDNDFYSVTPETVEEFFNKNVKEKVLYADSGLCRQLLPLKGFARNCGASAKSRQ